MKEFLQRFGTVVIGFLSGFDRLVFRGTLRNMAFEDGLRLYLSVNKIKFKDAGAHFHTVSERVKTAALHVAEEQRRPVKYLPSPQTSKEAEARKIAQQDRITTGLICVLTSVEPCYSAVIRRDRQARHQYIEYAPRKCLHYYFYWLHPEVGLMHARLQTWFPFNLQVCLNGREWLDRSLDREKIAYRKSENCFLEIQNWKRAQQLAEAQLTTAWPRWLDSLTQPLISLSPEVFGKFDTRYYWSAHQTEWATDVMFKTPQALAELYSRFLRHGIHTFKSADVLRFLGQYVSPTGRLHSRFKGEVLTSLKQRPEGVRLKHWVGQNSLKLYDKQGSVLRTETTINHAQPFKVYRPKEGGPEDQLAWRYMRQGVADVYRRAEVSQACNERYLRALAQTGDERPLEEALHVCQPVRWEGRQVRGLNPFGADDALLSELGRGEYNLNGFRNRDLQARLFKATAKDVVEKRRRSGQITRKLRLLRAHGLIKKVPKTHRYHLTDKGRTLVVALGVVKQASTNKLAELAA
jgi:hypothetical protein